MITIKIVLKSAQPNKPGLAEDYYIQEAGTLKHMSAGVLAELAWIAILNLLLRADHISQCADHNITVCCIGAVCFDFRTVS